METHEAHTPGWDAIDAALETAFPGQEPLHWGIDDVPEEGGITGISAYGIDQGWCYVTYGFSELFQKETDDPSTSGWGFELTMRVRTSAPEPPDWPLDLLSGLGEYVFAEGRPFADGHLLDPGGPITGGRPRTRLTALAFAPDPDLAAIETPNGEVTFLTVVGVTQEELQRMRGRSADEVRDVLTAASPGLVTDPGR